MKYCYECDNEKDFRYKNSNRIYKVKGKEYSLDVQVPVCSHCGQEIYDPDVDPVNQQRAFDMYREEHHLLKPSEITTIREKYGLAIDRFSELIGLGKKTLWRYENGYIPDKAQNNLIMLMENPKNFRTVYENEKGFLRPDERNKVEDALEHLEAESSYTCVTVAESSVWASQPDNIIYLSERFTADWSKEYGGEYVALSK
jgi:putative zinc finger/helix-turn-helix YgiT family protein